MVFFISNVQGQLMQDTFECLLYNETKTFSFSEITDVDIDVRGHIWISMTNHGMLRINQNEGKKYGYAQTGRTRNDVFCFYEDAQERILIGRDGGIDQYIFESDNFKRVAESSFSKIEGYENTVYEILQIPGGKYLVGSKSGVHLLNLEKDTIEKLNLTGAYQVDGTSSDKHIYSMVLDESREVVWCTSRMGLLKIDLKDFKTQFIYCPFHGDKSWPLELMNEMYLYEDALFINFKHQQILAYNILTKDWDLVLKKRFKEYIPALKDSFDLTFKTLSCYDDRYLVIPTPRMGVLIMDMSTRLTHKPYLKHNQFASIGKFQNPDWLDHKYLSETYFGIIDNHGHLWSSEVREIVVKTKMPVLAPSKNELPAKLHISQLWVDNRPVEHAYYHRGRSKYVFKKYERDLAMKFDLVNPPFEKYELEYAVNGADFKPNFNQSLATFNTLKGGGNRIVLRATVGDEVVQTKQIQFEIDKGWGEKWHNQLLLVLGFSSFLGGVYWIWMSRIKEKIRLEDEFSKKIAEVKMAAFRSQMNPHFMFNSLNSINRFIVKMEPQKASEYLSKFSKLMRQVLTNSTSQLVDLESDLSALRLYLDMEKLRFGDKFSYEISIEKEIDGNDCLIPPLLIQPYVENAIWHGLMPLKLGGELKVAVSKANNQIKISIEDNGIGRVRSLQNKQREFVKSKSMGMEITKNRLELIEKVYELKTQLKITDKYKGEIPTGTLVELIMPYLNMDKINNR